MWRSWSEVEQERGGAGEMGSWRESERGEAEEGRWREGSWSEEELSPKVRSWSERGSGRGGLERGGGWKREAREEGWKRETGDRDRGGELERESCRGGAGEGVLVRKRCRV